MVGSAGEEEEQITCPICLSTPDDGNEGIFVQTPCGHFFRKECLERVLLKINPLQDGIKVPTLGKCPICRKDVDMFDLCDAASGREVYENPVVSSWPITGAVFKQRVLLQVVNPNLLMTQMIEDEGPVKGYGLTFDFNADGFPSLTSEKPLQTLDLFLSKEDAELFSNVEDALSSMRFKSAGGTAVNYFKFTTVRLHEDSRTFKGTVKFDLPVVNDGLLFRELEVLLQYNPEWKYVRIGLLRWKLWETLAEKYPLDGKYEVAWSNGTTIEIVVHRHSFDCMGIQYKLTIDNDHRPSFIWPPQGGFEDVVQKSDQKFEPESYLPKVGETIRWATNAPSQSMKTIVWRRLRDHNSMSIDYQISAKHFVYQRENTPSDVLASPSYNSDALWGNTFCQAYSVGLASYHFEEETDADGNMHAYISYESPRTSEWPDLDNGAQVSPRVPFREIQWDQETRTFRGKIKWREDFGTTWQNEGEWRYTIIFDPTFTFVLAGTVESDSRPPHNFGSDLVYINAALEGRLVERKQYSNTTEQYMGIIKTWLEAGASPMTLGMLGDLAMSVFNNEDGLIDQNF